ncbi:MAG: hypothetical protein A2Z83_04450 [Omnitrophica bacterium GWA2_52_8]|nr:MAG: hypothetical protein A2Z83_04450 [Omnitrophica bacterium GWA2_52_8]
MKAASRSKKIYLIRHGSTPWTRAQRYQGRTDLRLNVRGRREIRSLIKLMEKPGPEKVYVSGLRRAAESAAILNKVWKVPLIVDLRLNELSFGRWEGQTGRQLIAAKDRRYRSWCRGRDISPPGGESFRRLRRRIARFVKDLRAAPVTRAAVVAHGGSIRMILAVLLGFRARQFWSFKLDPASLTVVTLGTNYAQCEMLNLTAARVRFGRMGLHPKFCARVLTGRKKDNPWDTSGKAHLHPSLFEGISH